MVAIEFRSDPDELTMARTGSAITADFSSLSRSFFRMPIRFHVGESDLLGWKDPVTGSCSCWRTLPLIDFALTLIDDARMVWQDGIVYADPGEDGLGTLTYQRVGDEISIHSELTGHTGRVAYEVLLSAALSFAQSVRVYLLHHFPEFLSHPELGPWFRGETEEPDFGRPGTFRRIRRTRPLAHPMHNVERVTHGPLSESMDAVDGRTIIAFRVDPQTLREDRIPGPLFESGDALLTDLFEMPVRMRISQRDMLQCNRAAHVLTQGPGQIGSDIVEAGHSACVWIHLPLLHVAWIGLQALEHARRTGYWTYRLPIGGVIRFRVSGDNILVESDITGEQADVPYDDLSETWKAFRLDVREFLTAEFPELRNHPHLTWFRNL